MEANTTEDFLQLFTRAHAVTNSSEATATEKRQSSLILMFKRYWIVYHYLAPLDLTLTRSLTAEMRSSLIPKTVTLHTLNRGVTDCSALAIRARLARCD
ncbi:hypothetical protein CEXT_515851 [Caerostris extrusa]|uniref:Uncharacterized protein n=1 Tax=Caerostris extrusa TaxID=172846 RepID=A0AAV4UTV8_CAEEX|nr:hypothetical protein CEXT_515851 [Caerostris extrusa]